MLWRRRYHWNSQLFQLFQFCVVRVRKHTCCPDCGASEIRLCSIFKPSVVVEDAGKVGNSSLPLGLSMCPSAVPGSGGLGIWADIRLEEGTKFGPYRGKLSTSTATGWQLYKDGQPTLFIDGSNSKVSNWMRYVNVAEDSEKQNLMAYQCWGQIYYRTTRVVVPGMELLVWYGTHPKQQTLRPVTADIHRCSKCFKLFTSESYLNRHMQKIHPAKTGQERYRCSACGYATDNKDNFKKHVRIHSGDRPFVCSHCGKGFAQKVDLVDHERSHTGEQPYCCETCAKCFSTRSSYRRHLLTHTEEKPFHCPVCGKDFRVHGSYLAHMKTHTRQKPFRCQFCNLRFSTKDAQKKHEVRKHTRDFKHVCQFCGKGYYGSWELEKHLRNQHATELIDVNKIDK